MAWIEVAAVHEQGLVARLAMLLNTHSIAAFHYDVNDDGSVRLTVRVLGGESQLDRVAARFRRVIGVVDVRVDCPVDRSRRGSGAG